MKWTTREDPVAALLGNRKLFVQPFNSEGQIWSGRKEEINLSVRSGVTWMRNVFCLEIIKNWGDPDKPGAVKRIYRAASHCNSRLMNSGPISQFARGLFEDHLNWDLIFPVHYHVYNSQTNLFTRKLGLSLVSVNP